MNKAKTPLEDLKKEALLHYYEASQAIQGRMSFIPKAINAYDPTAISQKTFKLYFIASVGVSLASLLFGYWIGLSSCS